MRGLGKRLVYILRSQSDGSRHYVGITSNVDERLEWHNTGLSGQTVWHRPWSVIVSLEFPTEQAALRFERPLVFSISPVPPPPRNPSTTSDASTGSR
jgi:predicted GIY-YIG superfamily endonuclease